MGEGEVGGGRKRWGGEKNPGGDGRTQDGEGRLGKGRGDVEGNGPGDERKEKVEKVRLGSGKYRTG